ncbi:hypothetical protein B0F90DRAFT_169475 [Multifurca ochricompacta]|uniref:Uncharacterized protein n=1 Tax=Multifurca ochricompacta TaxID=376703 RepID=A0AAD4M5Z4_9AGAM|nr:hypothetical protein B0F90DRAFT_169475 [Multifurca ochricompacta]
MGDSGPCNTSALVPKTRLAYEIAIQGIATTNPHGPSHRALLDLFTAVWRWTLFFIFIFILPASEGSKAVPGSIPPHERQNLCSNGFVTCVALFLPFWYSRKAQVVDPRTLSFQ